MEFRPIDTEPYEADGDYHALDVQVGRPGVRVRARKGYVAPTPVVSSSTQT